MSDCHRGHPNPVSAEIRVWLRRYLVLDIAGWIMGLGLGCAVHASTQRIDAMAAAVILGENLGFYGAAIIRDWIRTRRRGGGTVSGVLRGLVVEFAAAECMDLALVRPASLVLATSLFGSAVAGILVGGIAADVVYYWIAGRSARIAFSGKLIPDPHD